MIFKKTARILLALVVFAGAGIQAHAQSTTQGAIAGTVFDASNAIVANAAVLIHNDANGSDLNLTSNGSGIFRAPQLTPGTYTVTFTAPGFSTRRETNVIVQVNGVTELDPHMVSGEVSTAVEVRSEVPVLKFDTAEFGGHLDTAEIESIPINNRRWSSLALTTPGVTNDANGFGLLSFRAISSLLNNVEVDGADDNQAFFSEERGRTRAGYSTSQAAVREFQVNTGVYSAEFGRAVGGVVNSVTKSGGNGLHGEAYFFNRNSSRSAFTPYATNTTYDATTNTYVTAPYRAKDNRNQYGFAVGGPLIKDKLFWFYAFDAYRRNFPGTAKANNPTSFFVNADAALPSTASCGTVIQSSGAITGSTASAADAPACLLAFRRSALGSATTYAQAAAIYNGQLQAFLTDLGSVPRFGNQLINTPKLDWQVNQKNHLSALYHRLRWDSPGGVQTQGTNNYAIDTFGTDFVKLDYTLVKLDTLITNNFTNEVRYQYGRELNNEGNQKPSAYTVANLLNSTTGIAPQIALDAATSGTGFYLGQPYYGFRVAYPDERKWQVGDTASFVFGKHSIRFGEDIVHNYDLQNNVFEGNGYINYNTKVNYITDLTTKAKACNAAGSGVATSITGFFPCYSFYAAGFGPAVFDLSTMDYGFFVQDDWKITPRLTLNLGVRYDYENIPQPYPSLSGTAGGTLAITSSHPSDKNNFGPRFGFAWDPFGLGKTAVHGGFGLYYGRIPNAAILNAYENTGSANSQSTPSFTSSNTSAAGLPTITAPPTAPAPGTKTAYYLDGHLQNPYTEQFDLAVQQDLGYSNILSVSYIGALGRELPNFLNLNIDPTKTYTIPYTVAAGPDGTCGPVACGTYSVKAYAGRQVTANTSTSFSAIDPSYGSVTSVLSNINSNYHALSVDVTNRAYKYITFDANYTWAHALDYSQNQFTSPSANNWIDPFASPRVNYGNSSLNIRHRAVGWAVLNAPGLEGHSPLTYLTNGWSLQPLVSVQSGLPYSATASVSTPQQCYPTTANNTTCYTPAGTGIAGTGASQSYIPFVGRNTLAYPRAIVVDLRVTKSFLFAEKYNLQLMGEAFNLANHQNVTGVSTQAYVNTTTQSPFASSVVNRMVYQSATFGVPSSANSTYAYNPRLIQIAARLVF